MIRFQISGVKQGSVVAVLGSGSKLSQLWFFLTEKSSSETDGFIEGRWLYDKESEDDARLFDHRVEDDVIKLAKTTVMDSDVPYICIDRGVYAISHETIRDLEVVVEYENDNVVDGQNYFVSENADVSDMCSVDHDVAIEAMQKASSWKSKVSLTLFFVDQSM